MLDAEANLNLVDDDTLARAQLAAQRRKEEFQAKVVEDVRKTLAGKALKLEALFKEWDEDGDGTIDKKEWRKAMPSLGIQASTDVLDTLTEYVHPPHAALVYLDPERGTARRVARGQRARLLHLHQALDLNAAQHHKEYVRGLERASGAAWWTKDGVAHTNCKWPSEAFLASTTMSFTVPSPMLSSLRHSTGVPPARWSHRRATSAGESSTAGAAEYAGVRDGVVTMELAEAGSARAAAGIGGGDGGTGAAPAPAPPPPASSAVFLTRPGGRPNSRSRLSMLSPRRWRSVM